MYLGFALVRHGEVTGPETPALREQVIPVAKPGGHAMPCKATLGSTWVYQETEGPRGSLAQSLFSGFPGEEWVGQGRQL